MKTMKPLQLGKIETENIQQSYSDRNFRHSPIMYTTLQTDYLKKSFSSRAEQIRLSNKGFNVAQQRRAIRNLFDQESPKNMINNHILQITGNRKQFKKFSLSPTLIKSRKPLLSPVPIEKSQKTFISHEKTIIRSETLNSCRRSIPINAEITEISDPDSCEDSLRIESRYFHH